MLVAKLSVLHLLLLAYLTVSVYSQNCNNAPTASLQVICNQIAAWSLSSRAISPVSPQSVAAPGAAGPGFSALAASVNPTTAQECMDIACLCGFFGGSGGSNCVLRNGQRLTQAYRKEYRVMTDQERNRYHTAMWTIKGNGDYDVLSRIHSSFATSPGAHSGPAFLPWHREFIKRLEIALRRVDPSVSLPYWDSTLDSTIPNPAQSSLFTNELMGQTGSDGLIATGAFRGWRTVDNSRPFRRSVGSQGRTFQESDISTLMSTFDFTQVLAYTAPSANCPNPAAWTAVEYAHGNPHIFIGGDMFSPLTSTNDPIFWNHHSFVDLIWENWRLARQSRSARETQFPPNNIACSSAAHFGSNTMQPFFPMVNTDGLANAYTDNLYTFAPRPSCSAGNPNGCGSRFLFCDLSHGNPRCAAKIAVNGNCGGYSRSMNEYTTISGI
ncbi:common central domain of tyrosinase [Oesophagostomum dentatum]|uniref:Common central domain of tyrosinase n=1 Tax=Oesophagostomum dentatum TaxID=61180 RepID=A0A0B1SX71_OESDE|nr:common central domain of tyrosinase [Oesophagostomum dentatum]